MIYTEINKRYPDRDIEIDVSEDGENGSEIIHEVELCGYYLEYQEELSGRLCLVYALSMVWWRR